MDLRGCLEEAQHHDGIAREYDGYWVDRVQYSFLAMEMLEDLSGLGLEPSSSVLDLGSGTGSVTGALAGTYDRVAAADISMGMLKVLHEKEFGSHEVQCSAHALPFRSASFDAVVCSKTLHHLDPGARSMTYAQVRRVLKDGGLFYIIEDAVAPGPLRAAADSIRSRFSPGTYPSGSPTRTGREGALPAPELLEEVRSAGFAIIFARHTFHLPFNWLHGMAQRDPGLARSMWDLPKRVPLIRDLGGAVRIAARTAGHPR